MTNRIDFIAIGDEKIHSRGCETRIRFALQRMSPPMRARGCAAAPADRRARTLQQSWRHLRIER
jgi:hypothetical protein